ncbi:restriction endonuclease subunit S [Anaerovibrio sp. JC8]|uniref:restriction endonuclease subunit S n=1 Tax=Anaerovibrio sp. JC8 TaxID=1240085 RepID=UPI000A0FEED3|nr:restriction endonuclease subunit S [Anaerovibrio sp. JC8]
MIYKLGDLTEQRREKYSGGELPICGVSKDGIIPPKQQEADISIYNVLYHNDFIFNPARMELNSIALNDNYDKAICSSLYEIFYVKESSLVLPDYLQMIVKTDNFRRFCAFVGSGSVREYCRYANIAEYPIDLPSMERQKELVRYSRIIDDRIKLKQKINDNLAV